jgi:hypothetical protein
LPKGHDSLVKVNESRLMGQLFGLSLHPQVRVVINRNGVNSLPMGVFVCATVTKISRSVCFELAFFSPEIQQSYYCAIFYFS